MKALAPDLRRMSRNSYSEESLTSLFHNLIGGLCSFVNNCPLDMLIERRLREDFPALRPSQFLSSGATIRALPAKVHPVAGNC